MNDREPRYPTESETCAGCGRWFPGKREAHEAREDEAARREENGLRLLQLQAELAHGA